LNHFNIKKEIISMERMPSISVLSLFLNGSAIAFAGMYFMTYQQPIIVISLSLSLIANMLNYYRLDMLENRLDALCSRCVPK